MPRRVREAVWLAVATGVSIACYSAVDRVGARLIAPWLYAALIWTFTAVFLVGGIALVDRRHRRAAERALGSAAAVVGTEAVEAVGPVDPPPGHPAETLAAPSGPPSQAAGWVRAAIGGLVTVGAYLLVLVAYVFAPLAVVAPVRESAIVLVSGWGSFRLGEAATRGVAVTRLGAALVIVVGAFLLALEA